MSEDYIVDVITQKLNIKIEKNSKGYNWEVTVTNADTVDDAIRMLDDAETKLWQIYGEPMPIFANIPPEEVEKFKSLTKS